MAYYGGIYTLQGRSFGIKDNAQAIVAIDSANVLEYEYGHLKASDLTKKAVQELQEYLEGKRRIFTVPLAPSGSSFALAVYQALCLIPYGETRSYQQVAQMIGRPKAARAVGFANHRNPILIMIPCHRVIGSNGRLVGYANGLDFKRRLLNLEGSYGDEM